MSISGWMDEKDVVYIHNGISFSHEKGGYLVSMDGPREYYGKWDKSDK